MPHTLSDLAPAYVRAIAPYQPGKPISDVARELGLAENEIVKLASNENPLGPSPHALAAIGAALNDLALYPDGGGFALKAAIAAKFKVAPECILLGNGSNDVLELVARTFLAPGDSAVYSQHAFAVYPLATQAVGATGVEVPAKAYGNDLDGLRGAIRPDTKIVFLANPNNPTGTFIAAPALKAWLATLPSSVLVVLDEAYGEYLDAEHAYDSVPWLSEFPNLIVSHTLSKAYGLAGLRIGFGLASPELVALMNRVRQPFNVNHLAMTAAVAALSDDAFIEKSRAVNRAGKAMLEQAFTTRGIPFSPSFGNFVTFQVSQAHAMFEALLHQGVIVRPIAGYGLPDWLRVTIGSSEQNARFIEALDRVRGQA